GRCAGVGGAGRRLYGAGKEPLQCAERSHPKRAGGTGSEPRRGDCPHRCSRGAYAKGGAFKPGALSARSGAKSRDARFLKPVAGPPVGRGDRSAEEGEVILTSEGRSGTSSSQKNRAYRSPRR